jgi:hypothetical protein
MIHAMPDVSHVFENVGHRAPGEEAYVLLAAPELTRNINTNYHTPSFQ